MTFSNLMDPKGRVEGERGDLSKKMSSAFRREGSLKEGEEVGLCGYFLGTGEGDLYKGGYSSII